MVEPSTCAMYLLTVQSSVLRMLFENLKEILHDVNLVFSPTGMSVLTLDGSKVALVWLNLLAQNFEEWKCNSKQEYGVNMHKLWLIVKQATRRDSVTLYVSNSNSSILYVHLVDQETEQDTEYELNLLDIDSESMSIPDVSFDSVITMPSSHFQKLMRAMQDVGEDITITYSNRQLVMSCQGDWAKQTTTVRDKDHDVEATDDAYFSATYPLKFLVLFSKSPRPMCHHGNVSVAVVLLSTLTLT